MMNVHLYSEEIDEFTLQMCNTLKQILQHEEYCRLSPIKQFLNIKN